MESKQSGKSSNDSTDGLLQKIVLVLSSFNVNRPIQGLSELSRTCKLPKTTTLRISSALCDQKLLSLDPVTKKYRLGYRILELAQVIDDGDNLLKVARPLMIKLRDEIEETVTLTIESEDLGICIERVESRQSLRFSTPLGEQRPLHAGAARKVLMAFLSPPRVQHILEMNGLSKLTDNTVLDPKQLLRELEQIRVDQYAISFGEHNPGVSAISVPVMGFDSKPIASITIAGPIFRLTREHVLEYLPTLRECAFNISKGLGYLPN
jgi:IclR family KDG regulon transcriptional repressor